jgi:hypothetical protein
MIVIKHNTEQETFICFIDSALKCTKSSIASNTMHILIRLIDVLSLVYVICFSAFIFFCDMSVFCLLNIIVYESNEN